jgi:hypothetical protein
MSYEEISCTKPRARKEYSCSWCGEKIIRGETHQSRTYKNGGDFNSSREHTECAAAMSTLNFNDWDNMDNCYEAGEFKRGTTESKI